ncbi:hypothetical protein C1A50_0812 [Paenibacillus polymyxa]|nr:hypothetical protein C1A50_0812 [Paenibacillus polymyxa]
MLGSGYHELVVSVFWQEESANPSGNSSVEMLERGLEHI